MKIVRFCFLIFIVFDSCIDPFSVDSANVPQRLVVEGMITNEPGPYSVKLFYSQQPDAYSLVTKPESEAQVWIISNAGDFELLQEAEKGLYETQRNGIRGKVGLSYRLRILTASGKEYATDFTEMKSAGALNNLYYELEKNGTGLPQDAKLFSRDVLNFYVDASTNVEQRASLLRWRWTGVYEAKTFPEKNKKTLPGGGEIPDPLPCSGYILGPRGLTKVSDCTCCQCWGYDYSRVSIVSKNNQVEANSFNRVLLNKQLITKMRFYNRYYLEAEQLSLSESEYNFWKLTADQQRATGDLFQPNSVKIHGNVYCVSDPAEEILGILSVSEIKRKSIFIDPQIAIPYKVPLDTMPSECKDVVGNPSVVRPTFW